MCRSVVIDAEASAGQVTVNGLTVPGAKIISLGKGESSGCLLIFGDKAFYLTSNATDLESTITKLTESINKIATILTSIGAGMTGPTTAPPGTLATDVLELTMIATELNQLKEVLK